MARTTKNYFEDGGDTLVIEGDLVVQNGGTLTVDDIVIDGDGSTTVADGSITAAKLAANAVETAKIRDGNVTSTKLEAAVQALLALAGSALQPGEIELEEGSPVNAVGSSVVMTIDDVAVHGEKVQIGDEVFQFAADEAQTVDEGATPVDIENDTTKSSGALTIDTQPNLGDTFAIGPNGEEKEYTIVPDGTANAEGEIPLGATLGDSQLNVVAAINGTDDINTPNPYVSAGAFGSDISAITALAGGTAGDAIKTTSTFTTGTNKFGAATLGGGADCVKADAKTALLAALENSEIASGVTGEGDTLTIAAKTKGTAGDEIAISTDMANGSFANDATTLGGGVNGTVGTQWQTYVDASYLYVCIAENTISDANWRRIDLGSAY